MQSVVDKYSQTHYLPENVLINTYSVHSIVIVYELKFDEHSAEGSIPVISSSSGPAVGGITNITENVCSSGTTIDDSMQKNVIGGTVVASQVDLVELSASAMAHEINTVISTNDVDEKWQNEKGGSDFTS